MDRAYSLLTIKAVDEEQRIIRGIATTPSTDRMEDVVEPLGAEFALPIPFLWQHESREAAIGQVISAKPTAEGIPVEIQLAKDDVPGPLKDRLDYAWRAIKMGLVRGLSVGFMPIETADISGGWGQRFIKWAWYELSAVTIPANAEATILAVKSLDIHGAASGARATPPGASGTPVKMLLSPKSEVTVNYAESIKSFEATRAAKAARMNEIQDVATKAGQTKDAAQQEEFDTAAGEIKAIDRELVDLRALEALNVKAATPVPPAPNAPAPSIVVRSQELPPGLRFARVARLRAMSVRTGHDVEKLSAKHYPDDFLTAKAVAAGAVDSYDGTWADPLVGAETNVYADFVEFLRPQTILGKFGTGTIPALLRVPFRVPLLGETSGGSAGWVGEGKAKPLTKSAFERRTLVPMKVANIAVVTEELLRSSAISADMLLRNMLARALQERLDIDFINPDKALDPGISPASITNTATPIPSRGNDAEAVRADILALTDPFLDANNPATSAVLIMSAKIAMRLASLRNALGQREFPDIGMGGGSIDTVPVITSEYVPTDSDGAIVVLLNAGNIYLGDDGGVAVDISREASLEMSASPSHDSVTPTPAQLVSMFQTNSVAFRAERIIDWMKRRDEAVQYLSAVNWGQPTS